MRSRHLVLMLVICLYIFSPAVLVWWHYLDEYWYQPWVLWFLVIVCGFIMQMGDSKE